MTHSTRKIEVRIDPYRRRGFATTDHFAQKARLTTEQRLEAERQLHPAIRELLAIAEPLRGEIHQLRTELEGGPQSQDKLPTEAEALERWIAQAKNLIEALRSVLDERKREEARRLAEEAARRADEQRKAEVERCIRLREEQVRRRIEAEQQKLEAGRRAAEEKRDQCIEDYEQWFEKHPPLSMKELELIAYHFGKTPRKGHKKNGGDDSDSRRTWRRQVRAIRTSY
jgi:hypothetical protein